MASVNSIYDIDLVRFDELSILDHVEELMTRYARFNEELLNDRSRARFNSMIDYVFKNIKEVANIKFTQTDSNEKISIFAKTNGNHWD